MVVGGVVLILIGLVCAVSCLDDSPGFKWTAIALGLIFMALGVGSILSGLGVIG